MATLSPFEVIELQEIIERNHGQTLERLESIEKHVQALLTVLSDHATTMAASQRSRFHPKEKAKSLARHIALSVIRSMVNEVADNKLKGLTIAQDLAKRMHAE